MFYKKKLLVVDAIAALNKIVDDLANVEVEQSVESASKSVKVEDLLAEIRDHDEEARRAKTIADKIKALVA